MGTLNETSSPPSRSHSRRSEFDGSDFSNNLFTDLAPLLTLFGEQVTKQFLSQAMGYGDDILLAMAPLGILTCVVSAIRVGGRKWLKALVGRARESRATAEMEIMSSTSDAICELWSGTEIVRERGIPKTKEFIYRQMKEEKRSKGKKMPQIVYNLETACQHRLLGIKQPGRVRSRWLSAPPLMDAQQHATRLMRQAPNLTLNVAKALISPVITWSLALLGVIVQLAVLAIAVMVTYRWHVPEQGSSVDRYGFPVFLTGSVVLSVGIFLCSYIIENTTDEVNFDLYRHRDESKIVRIQCACTVGDQRYGSYAILNEKDNTSIRTSRIDKPPDFSVLSILATLLSLGGYVLQFIGLRAMHWIVAIAVLSGTLIMACIRAYVCRGLAADPKWVELQEGHELSWIALDAFRLDSFELDNATTEEDDADSVRAGSQSIESFQGTQMADVSSLARKVIGVRKQTRELVNWQDESVNLAHRLANAITKTLQYVCEDESLFMDFDEQSSVFVFEERAISDLNPARTEYPRHLSAKVIPIKEIHNKLGPRTSTSRHLTGGSGFHSSVKNILNLAANQKDSILSTPEDNTHAEIIERDGSQDSALTESDPARSPPARIYSRAPSPQTRRPPSPLSPPPPSAWLHKPVIGSDGNDLDPNDPEPLGAGNWFWEHREVVDEAADGCDPRTPLGLIPYIFHKYGQIFGVSFTWESKVTLGGPKGMGRRSDQYRFRAQCVYQRENTNIDDNVPEELEAGSNAEKRTWDIDIDSLAAIISLWTFSLQQKLKAGHESLELIRSFGYGWDVPIPASVSTAAKRENIEKVIHWAQSSQTCGSPLGQDPSLGARENADNNGADGQSFREMVTTQEVSENINDSVAEPDADFMKVSDHEGSPEPNHAKQSKGQLPQNTGIAQEYKVADFYAVWIERKFTASRFADLRFVTGLQAYERRAHPPYHFAGAVAPISRFEPPLTI
ncbi:uncharacterized protein LDX57_002570 [Aspergillus melleus]|uniref:uncharacterized protein n=1 Tax=Aspergillus melleus TaxID=138277 RepID=UPI001E8ECFD6|nr:uncharacterized protein LDX57_002570 [Aspergillus melleus]KAH8424827.1 hypothetical protein LDX57_002570 [Aspergillus melleus]